MRKHARRAAALLLVAAVAGMALPPVAGAKNTDEDAATVGRALGDAGAALGMVRLLPDSVPRTSLTPRLMEEVADGSAFESGFGLASVQANSSASLYYEQSIAQAAPYGAAVAAGARRSVGTLIQTALPDNAEPAASDLTVPESPMDALVRVQDLTGNVHARWDDAEGPCVDGTITTASTESQRLALLRAIPTLPDLPISDLALPDDARLARGFDRLGSLGTLGGLLSGTQDDEDGYLVTVPGGFTGTATVDIVDDEDRAVRARSIVSTNRISLLPGSRAGLTVRVVRKPRLTVTSTGEEGSSRVSYTTPVLEVRRGSTTLFTLDRDNPTQDVPIGVPTAGYNDIEDAPRLAPLPIIGGVAETRGGRTTRLSDEAQDEVMDLFVLRLRAGGLNREGSSGDVPFAGYRIGASARLLDVALLPTEALAEALRADGDDAADELPFDVPSSLAQISVGEQVARAFAPAGGATCGMTTATERAPRQGLPSALVSSASGGASAILLWIGATALLAGAALLVALPGRRSTADTPSPTPRK